MQFLGLAIDLTRRPPTLIESRSYFGDGRFVVDEVKVVDLGGQFVDLSRTILNAQQLQLLANFFNAGSKATAHLTSDGSHDFDHNDFHPAVDLVVDLLRTHLYAPTNQPMNRFGLPPL